MALDSMRMKDEIGWRSKFSFENATTSHQRTRYIILLNIVNMHIAINFKPVQSTMWYYVYIYKETYNISVYFIYFLVLALGTSAIYAF